MKLKNTLALSLAAVMAAGLTACGSAASPAADSTAAESTEAAADTTAAPDGDGEGVVEAVLPHPGHVELFLVLLLKPGEHLCIIHTLGLVVQHQYPTAGGILRIEVELSALHGGLDVAGAAGSSF